MRSLERLLQSFGVSAAAILLIPALAGIAAADDTYAVFKSIDGGRSWVRSDSGMKPGARTNVFVSAGGTVFAGTDAGIYVSSDEARSWHPVKQAPISAMRVISFATLGESVFAGTGEDGLWVSSDGGKTWAANSTFPAKKVRSLLAHEGKVYAGTDSDGVFVSGDSGRSWISLKPGFPAGAQVFALTAARGRIFAGLYSRGAYRWDESGRRWTKAGSVSPLVLTSIDDVLIAGHNPGGLYWSEDEGVSWSKGEAQGERFAPDPNFAGGEYSQDAPVWEAAADSGLVIAGAAAGIYLSKDHGRTWSPARAGLPAASPGVSFLVDRNFALAAIHVKGKE